MPLLYSLTLFCCAVLLFQVQPMVGKLLLPKLGGTPAVWNTCLVFFQVALLTSYGYAHAATRLLGSRRQALAHLGVLMVPALVLPIAFPDGAFWSHDSNMAPTWLVLRELTVRVGLPFFVIATTAPLVQRWFADSGHRRANDPYFLYAASNLGSMIGLIAYPLLVEPRLPLDGQSRWWMRGYAVCAALISLCAAALLARAPAAAPRGEPPPPAEPLTWTRRLSWVALAFVPSSLLLGCTTYISTDIAPIPLLWVLPLALYLLSFILVFARRPPLPHGVMVRLLPIAVLPPALVLLTGATELRGVPVWGLVAIHLLALFLAAMVGHGELARDRPPAAQLTEFYLWISAGGALGGLFNALLAPILFHKTGLTEYPLALVLACFLRPWRSDSSQRPSLERELAAGRGVRFWPGGASQRAIVLDVFLPGAVGALVVAAVLLLARCDHNGGIIRTAVAYGVPCVVVYTFVDRVPRFALGVGALFLASAVTPGTQRLFLERNFFGVVQVADVTTPEGRRFRTLMHGNTVHGQMSLDQVDAEGRREPLAYYHRTGPIGVLCQTWFKGRPDGQHVGAVGLGAGAVAYYARPGDRWTFYEIDPAVVRVAEDPAYFSYLAECRAGPPAIILGDAYLRLRETPERSFDLLILDAFSSDAIPVHLLTREALALYRSRLRPGGIMAFHVSNRYLNLRPILAKLAEDAGLVARGWHDSLGNPQAGKFESEWMIMAEREADFGEVAWPTFMKGHPDPRWPLLRPRDDTPRWTNDFSNLLSALGRPDEE